MYRNVKKIYLVHQFQQPIPKIWIRIFTKLFCPVSTTTGSGSHVEFCLECWSEKQQTPPIVLYLVMKDMTSNWNVIQFSAEFRYILFKWFVIDIFWKFLLKAARMFFNYLPTFHVVIEWPVSNFVVYVFNTSIDID